MRGFCCLVGLLGWSTATVICAAEPQDNQWTKATSGYWEEPFWSLGRLPAAGQTVAFFNDGFKALAIGSVTASNYPSSLSMERLIVHGSNNLLLLNWAGKAVPLRIATDFDLYSGAALHSHSSVIEAGTFNNGGRAMFGDEAIANFGTANIGHGSGPGELIISNAVISSDRMFIGYGGESTVNQYGGTNRVMRGEIREGLVLQYSGRYNLRNGTLEAERVDIFNSSVSAPFTVSGGLMRVPSGIGAGQDFLLEGGTLETSGIEFLRAGQFRQTGGNNVAGTILLPKMDYLDARYVLSGGTLKSTNVVLGAYWGSRGYFDQTSGAHTNGSMILWGYERTRQHHESGWYTLGGGLLVSDLVYVRGGEFYQSGGSNLADTVHISAGGGYGLSNGFLRASNIDVSSAEVSLPYSGSYFHQTGGRTHIENELWVDWESTFRVDGGIVNVANLSVHGTLVASGSMTNSGRITLAGGVVVVAENQTHHFGQLDLFSGALKLPAEPAVVRFRESRDVAWDSAGLLVITNWNGAAIGGGEHRVFVGSTAAGLSASQLRQVIFANPRGFAPGSYAARSLASGEIVPAEPMMIRLAKISGGLTLSWNQNYELFSATNVAGPFVHVMGASSPYTNWFSDRQRYFQIRLASP
jgi:hypothetical protein